MNKKEMKINIYQLDFAIHELVLFLDTHPTNRKALELLSQYREKRQECVALYEERYGAFVVTPKDVPAKDCWKWLESPWPWENEFWEA